MREQVELMERQILARRDTCAAAVRSAEAELATVDRKRQRLEDEFFAGNLDGKAYSRLSDAVEHQRKEAQRRMEAACQAYEEAKLVTVDVDQFVSLAERLDAWSALTHEELKQVLREVTDTLTVYQVKAPNSSKKGNPNPIQIVWRPKLDLVLVRDSQDELTAT
jgi:hypothetical protein